MSEQDPTETPAYGSADNPARYGAPLPPPPIAPASTWVSATPPPRRRRGARLVALGAALAVVAVAGGAGFALGRVGHDTSAPAGGQPSGYGGSPFGGTHPFRGTPFNEPGEPGEQN